VSLEKRAVFPGKHQCCTPLKNNYPVSNEQNIITLISATNQNREKLFVFLELKKHFRLIINLAEQYRQDMDQGTLYQKSTSYLQVWFQKDCT
jgi:hypothetical protein